MVLTRILVPSVCENNRVPFRCVIRQAACLELSRRGHTAECHQGVEGLGKSPKRTPVPSPVPQWSFPCLGFEIWEFSTSKSPF